MKTEQFELKHCKQCNQMTNHGCLKCKNQELIDKVNNLYRLGWIEILDNSINNRKTSWGEHPVNEWRNASDEIAGEVVNAIRKEWGMLHPFKKRIGEEK